MKSLIFVLFPLIFLACCTSMTSLSTKAIAQEQEHQHGAAATPSPAATNPAQAQTAANPAQAKPAPKPPTEAQRSFNEMKTLAGVWTGKVTLDPPMEGTANASVDVSIRVTSRGNSIVHEMQEAGTPLDAKKYDHPITMVYLDDDRLLLTHYCDAGNRPRMTGKLLPDGKTVEFSFLDVAGPTKYGNMHDGKFTVIDDNHHLEDWYFLLPGNKLMHAHADLVRKQDGVFASAGPQNNSVAAAK